VDILSLNKRLWAHFSSRRRIQVFLLLVLIILTSLVEVVSIGAVIPFLSVLADPEIVMQHQNAKPFLDALAIKKPDDAVVLVIMGFITAALLSGFFRILLLWYQARLGQVIGTDFSSEMFRRTLYQPYHVHAKRNSSEVISAVTRKTDQVLGGVINPSLGILSSIILVVFIVFALFFISPSVTIFTFIVFSVIYSLLIIFTRNALYINSKAISVGSNNIVKIVQEGLGGIRDVLIDSTQEVYYRGFRKSDLSLRRAQANTNVIGQTPKYLFESLSMVIVAVIAYQLSQEMDGLIHAIPVLGAFALGAQKLLPALQQIYSHFSTIRASEVSLSDTLELIEQDFSLANQGDLENITLSSGIVFNNVEYQYNEDSSLAVKDLCFSIEKGACIGIIGKTGSGKSTFLDLFMALLLPTKGSLCVDGVRIDAKNSRSWQKRIAHVPQMIFLADATVAENIAFGLSKRDINLDKVRLAARDAHIDEVINSLELGYDTLVGEQGIRLSGGQRQRIGIARALYKEAEVLVFDEATSALDYETEKEVMKSIHNSNRDLTILMVAHRLSTLQRCDRIIEFSHGEIKRQCSYSDIVD